MKHKILVVIDMQNDFIDGSLSNKEAQAIVPHVIEKIRTFDGNQIFFTRDTHQENYLETREGKNLPVKHCIVNTNGWQVKDEVYNALEEHENDCMINKNTFGSIELANKISSLQNKENTIEEIILVGVCTDICVISNALLLKAFMPEVLITVDSSCCAGVTPKSHQEALNAMKMCQINVI